MTSPGTESSYPLPPQSLNNSMRLSSPHLLLVRSVHVESNGDDVLCWLLSVSVFFCLLSLLFSPNVFGSVYLVTTAGFVTDKLM